MATPGEILKQYWGYDQFRPLQQEIISSVLEHKDTLALLPTGGGKSVCYQVPAILNEGLCLVISPLIALMQDQVARLKQLDIPAACIHSGMHYNDVKRTLDNTVQGGYKLLYISPERLQTELFKDYLSEFDVQLVAVDEAHCISQWGHDFRPDYLRIASIKELFPETPILALTASATPEVQQDIIVQLQLNTPAVFKQSFARNNIFYNIRYTENKSVDVLNDVNRNCSIIYCRSRRQTEALTKYLLEHGVAATSYHAGMTKDSREHSQEAWMKNDSPVIAATTAFGMGIDKPDVRMVLHFDAPEHPEAYYQEAGRAGRDGAASIALGLYNSTDIKRLKDSITLQFPPEAYLRQVYQAVAEYLQIAIGTEPDQYYSFDVFDFCGKFSLKVNEALPALKLLEREGLWTLSEAVYSPATIQFISNRSVLDELAKTHPTLGYVSIGLLRMYNTIFHFPTSIRESAIAKQLKMDKGELAGHLELLHKMGILEYRKPGEGPQMYFHHYRVDSKHLVIDLNRIGMLRNRHIKRTEAMIAYLEDATECRERMLLRYFGENPDKDCGHCDVCRDKEIEDTHIGHLRNELLRNIKRQNPVTIKALVSHYPSTIKEQALDILRNMIDEGVLSLKDNGTVYICN